MKRTRLIPPIFTLVIAAFNVATFAQTCISPLVWQPTVSGGSQRQTTWGGRVIAASCCASNQSAPGPAVFFHTVFAPARAFTTVSLSAGHAALDPVMYLPAL